MQHSIGGKQIDKELPFVVVQDTAAGVDLPERNAIEA